MTTPKNRKVTVLVFDTLSDHPVTLDCPECRKTPQETVKMVYDHIMANETSVIRTYSDDVVNFIGALVGENFIMAEGIEIVLPSGTVSTMHSEGYLVNWEYGIFSWHDALYDIRHPYLVD